MKQWPPNRKPGDGVPGLGSGSAILGWQQLTTRTGTSLQVPLFTARPIGRWWSVAAISHAGEAVKLGIFPHRRDALSAAAVMARACGGGWCP